MNCVRQSCCHVIAQRDGSGREVEGGVGSQVMLLKRIYTVVVHLVTVMRQPRSLTSELTSRNVVFGIKVTPHLTSR